MLPGNDKTEVRETGAVKRKLFDDDHEMFRDSVRKFLLAEAVPHMEEWRKQGVVDREIFRKAGDNGFLFMWAEERFGGLDLNDFRYEQVLIEELYGAGCGDIFIPTHNRLWAATWAIWHRRSRKTAFTPGASAARRFSGSP